MTTFRPPRAVALLTVGLALLALSRLRADGAPPALVAPTPRHVANKYGTFTWATPYRLSRCGTWPQDEASMRVRIAALGVARPQEYGWACVGNSVTDRMPETQRTGVTTAACEAWCEAQHNPAEATTGNWCCAWEPTVEGGDLTGTCTWSDGLATFVQIPPDQRVYTSRRAPRDANGGAPAPAQPFQPLAFEACTLASDEFEAVTPDIATQGQASSWVRKADALDARRTGPPQLGAPAGGGRGGAGAGGDGGDGGRRGPAPRQYAERRPAEGCRLDKEPPLAILNAATLSECSEACAESRRVHAAAAPAAPAAGRSPTGRSGGGGAHGGGGGAHGGGGGALAAAARPCEAFSFSSARAAPGGAGQACLLLERCHESRDDPGEWVSFRTEPADVRVAVRLAPVQLGAPLGMAAKTAGNAGAGGAGITPETRGACAPEHLAFAMEGEGVGTCSQACIPHSWWQAAALNRMRRGRCVENGCDVYLASRKQAGMPFDLYRCACPTSNRTRLYSCASFGMPALT
jgi:hypothetical protein